MFKKIGGFECIDIAHRHCGVECLVGDSVGLLARRERTDDVGGSGSLWNRATR